MCHMKAQEGGSVMHMADALLIPAVGVTMYAAAAVPAAISVKKVRLEQDTEKIPMMGIMGAFVFAAQMVNFTIPGTGSSGHLCGGMLLTALLGPYGAFLTMISVLVIQCLMFADGGILALGANIWNMAFYGCFVGYFCIYRPIMKNKISRTRLIAASMLGSIISLQLGAFSVALETLISGITELPFGIFLAVMQPIHLAVGCVEGMITAAVLCFVYTVRPEIFNKEITENKFSFKKTLITLAAAAFFIAGGLSLYACSDPDGLEWSVMIAAKDTEITAEGNVYEMAAAIQEKTAVLPDYGFADGGKEEIGTGISGIIGSLTVAAVCFIICKIGKFYRKRKNTPENVVV